MCAILQLHNRSTQFFTSHWQYKYMASSYREIRFAQILTRVVHKEGRLSTIAWRYSSKTSLKIELGCINVSMYTFNIFSPYFLVLVLKFSGGFIPTIKDVLKIYYEIYIMKHNLKKYKLQRKSNHFIKFQSLFYSCLFY